MVENRDLSGTDSAIELDLGLHQEELFNLRPIKLNYNSLTREDRTGSIRSDK